MQLYRQMRKGSTPVLILSLLAEQPMHGYHISQEMEQRSEGYFTMKGGCSIQPCTRWSGTTY